MFTCLKLELSKQCFCPPVPANERDTEAWDTARLITPQNRSCNWLQPKHFTLPPRSTNRSHSSKAFVVPLLLYSMFSLSHSLFVIASMMSLSTLWSSCATSFLHLLFLSFQQATERKRDILPLIPSPASMDADCDSAIVTVSGCHSNRPWRGPNHSRYWIRILLLFSQL